MNNAGTWLVVSDKDAVKLGLVSADGESIVHTRTLEEVKAVAAYDRLYAYQAEELAIEMGGAWIVDADGDTYWQAAKSLQDLEASESE